ncbi:U3 small nucleolar RNA-associated protein 18-like protein [Camelus dromedarius]|uniref:U3 small nucleolar RNA-associated protein 18-like protein n=1 Tax=Camelus dromedarius TaxID=9838 RepID=A0A5N4CK78_CAMDR|nr:U3 small nucleolar RNA-associated protein 18-like protein [Camelus dromedarius]
MPPARTGRMRPARRAGGGPGGPPGKRGGGGEPAPPQQRSRLTLQEDQPAAGRCREEPAFSDAEEDEGALLRRLRGPRGQVQKA